MWATGQHQVSEGEPYDLILTLQAGGRKDILQERYSLFSVDNSLTGFTGTNGAKGGASGRGAKERKRAK